VALSNKNGRLWTALGIANGGNSSLYYTGENTLEKAAILSLNINKASSGRRYICVEKKFD
jgi:hypothetical protein